MKTQFGSIIVAGSGKIGGHVASRNRGGAYLRTKVTPLNPKTPAQNAVRGNFSALSKQWSGLATGLRLGWNNAVSDFAKTDIFGDLRNPSGFNLFVKLNTNLTNSAQANITAVPAKLPIIFSAINSVNFAIVAATGTITLGNVLNNGAKVIVFATPMLSQGTTYAKNQMRIIGTMTVTMATINIHSAYIAKFGALTAGANVQVGYQIVLANGQVSVLQTAKATVIA